MARRDNSRGSRFRDSKGKWLTQCLFPEYCKDNEEYPYMYTLKDTDYKGLPSLRRIYLELEDPTEYRIATEYLGGWGHWKCLLGSNWFKGHVEQWRDELEVKLKCKALKELMDTKEKTFLINKFLINREWEVKRGRPTKEEKERNIRISSQVGQQVDNDFKLLNLNTNAV